MLVRGKLPPATLRALRLVCRAARDDLVDGRCSTLKFKFQPPPPHSRDGALATPPTQALVSLAGRLRSLTRLDIDGCGSGGTQFPYFGAEDAGEFAAALERLPRPWALTALDMGSISFGASRQAGACDSQLMASQLAGAVGRLRCLRSLRINVWSSDGNPAATAAGAKLLLRTARRLPALETVGVAFSSHRAGELLRQVPIEQLLPLQQLKTLELGQEAVALLPALLAPAVASNLTSLRSLEGDFYCSFPRNELEALKALWRAPFMPQLTSLELKRLSADDDDVCDFLEALSRLSSGIDGGGDNDGAGGDDRDRSGSGGRSGDGGGSAVWPQLRSLRVGASASRPYRVCGMGYDCGLVSKEALRCLLTAVDPGKLEELVVGDWLEGAAAALVARAGDFTTLKRLRLDGRDLCRDYQNSHLWRSCSRPAAHWRAIQLAPFAPLESLDIGDAGWLLWAPERLQALLSAPWAASLVELALEGGKIPYHELDEKDAMKPAALAALSGLSALRRLVLFDVGVSAAALEEATARGWTDGLAARLTELDVCGSYPLDGGVLVALGSVRFERLERLSCRMWDAELTLAELEAFGAAGAPWLARLSFLELQFESFYSSPPLQDAVLDRDGPLRALHRGGGEVACSDD